MKQAKTIKKLDPGMRSFKAAAGISLPIFYEGAVVKIRDDAETTLDWEKVPYESKHHVESALRLKEITELKEI